MTLAMCKGHPQTLCWALVCGAMSHDQLPRDCDCDLRDSNEAQSA
jgi:hypothetical protein